MGIYGTRKLFFQIDKFIWHVFERPCATEWFLIYLTELHDSNHIQEHTLLPGSKGTPCIGTKGVSPLPYLDGAHTSRPLKCPFLQPSFLPLSLFVSPLLPLSNRRANEYKLQIFTVKLHSTDSKGLEWMELQRWQKGIYMVARRLLPSKAYTSYLSSLYSHYSAKSWVQGCMNIHPPSESARIQDHVT